MKTLFKILLLCALCGSVVNSHAATTYRRHIVLTNNPATSNAITIDGVQFIWTNNTLATLSFIATTNNFTNAATNLFLKLGVATLTNVQVVSMSNTTTITLESYADTVPSVSIGGNWAFVIGETNTSATSYYLAQPLFDGNDTNQWTNVANNAIDTVGYSNATHAIPNTAPALAQVITTRTNGQAMTNVQSRQAGTGLLIVDPQNRAIGNVTFFSVAITNGQLTMSGTQTVSGLVFLSAGVPYVFTPGGSNSILRLGELTNHFHGLFTNDTAVAFTTIGNRSTIRDVVSIFTDTPAGGGRFRVIEDQPGRAAMVFTNDSGSFPETWNVNSYDGGAGGRDENTLVRFGEFNGDYFAIDHGPFGESISIADRAPLNDPDVTHGTFRSIGRFGVNTNFGVEVPYDLTEISGVTSGPWVYHRNPTNDGHYVIFTDGGGPVSMTGVTNVTGTPQKGDWFWAMNGGSYAVTIVANSGLTHVGNRFNNSASNLTVNPLCWMKAIYDGSRWRVIYPEPFALNVFNAGANVTSTAANSFGIYRSNNLSGVMEFIPLLAGTNIHIVILGDTNLQINAVGGGGGSSVIGFTGLSNGVTICTNCTFLEITNGPGNVSLVVQSNANGTFRMWASLDTQVTNLLATNYTALINSVSNFAWQAANYFTNNASQNTNTLPVFRSTNLIANSVSAGTVVANTNFSGVMIMSNVQFAASANHQVDGNIANLWLQTNNAAQHTALSWTNFTTGQQAIAKVIGAASGGSDYVVTNVVPSGWLVSLDGGALATSATITVTNGQVLELSALVDSQLSTNVLDLISRRRTR